MILLPPHPQRAWLRSFWAAVCLLAGAFVGTLASLYRTEFLWLVAVIGVLFAAVGMIVPHHVIWPYRAWNKLARIYSGNAEALVLRISFYTVCVPVGWVGSRIQVKRPPSEGTLWLSRETQKPVDQPFHAFGGKGMWEKSWVVRYMTWAWKSGEIWQLMLLPFLLLLSAVQSTEEKSTVPENIYTLF